MIVVETSLQGAYRIELEKLGDERGFFARSFCRSEFEAAGLESNFCQQNTSESRQKNILRGMHYQTGSSSEVKYIRCHQGAILDVIIDLRRSSPTFMEHQIFELTEENYSGLYIPRGFAHGFLTLTEMVVVSYLVSSPYSRENERGISWNDPCFNIDWGVKDPILSSRDSSHPLFDIDRMSLDGQFLEAL